MPATINPLSTDQVLAFVQLAQTGSIRAAADTLHLTEQGARNRLIALEKSLGVDLYVKRKGRRHKTQLTTQGRRFLPQAKAFLAVASNLTQLFRTPQATHEVHIAASAYLTNYVLINAIKKFHAQNPNIRIRLSTRPERDIESALLDDPTLSLGFAAPYETPTELEYTHTFSMDWSLITPADHPLLKRKSIRLKNLTNQPLILFEQGSTGRQHILDAFGTSDLSPQIDMEATTTQIILEMVEAGLGISIVPLLPNGVVTKNHKLGIRSLGKQIRPILSGILQRKNEQLSDAAQQFIHFIQSNPPT